MIALYSLLPLLPSRMGSILVSMDQWDQTNVFLVPPSQSIGWSRSARIVKCRTLVYHI
jgi:hypothetical protein